MRLINTEEMGYGFDPEEIADEIYTQAATEARMIPRIATAEFLTDRDATVKTELEEAVSVLDTYAEAGAEWAQTLRDALWMITAGKTY